MKLIIGGGGRGGWNKIGGLENFRKINNQGGRLFGTLEYIEIKGRSFDFTSNKAFLKKRGLELVSLSHFLYDF